VSVFGSLVLSHIGSFTQVPLGDLQQAPPVATQPANPDPVRPAPSGWPTPFTHLGDHLLSVYTSPGPLLAYAVAVGSTVVVVASGADQSIRLGAQRDVRTGSAADGWGTAAYYGGYLLPVLVPLVLYGAGHAGGSRDLAGGGAAALQALGITVGTVTFLKWATGRPFPNHGGDPHDPARLDHDEYAKEFHPFYFHGDYAWPSGHAAASISVAAALTAYYRGSLAVPLVAYPIAAGISLGMIVGDHHWGSDVIAGALIGQAMGYTVGSAYRDEEKGAPRMMLVPLLGELRGLALVAPF
jgi:membrane-associated phospholipid phosphatase